MKRSMRIRIVSTGEEPAQDNYLIDDVKRLLLEYRGDDEVNAEVVTNGKVVTLEWPLVRVTVCPELEEKLEAILGPHGYVLIRNEEQTVKEDKYKDDQIVMEKDFFHLFLETAMEISRAIVPEDVESFNRGFMDSIGGVTALNNSFIEMATVFSNVWISDPNYRDNDYWQAIDEYIAGLKSLIVMDPVIFGALGGGQPSSKADENVLRDILIYYATKVTKKHGGLA